MAYLEVKDLTFRYPGGERCALQDLSFSVEEGELCLILSPSGGGKTTLLSLLEPHTAPKGERQGEILLRGDDPQIALLRQDAELGIVTDKVWHEIAFAPENRGLSTEEIRLRVAEAAGVFGLENLFRRDTMPLSGGEKVKVLLASHQAARPDLILLDEPTGMLDPMAEMDLREALIRLRTEFGATILVSEQRCDAFFAVADRVLYLEEGRLLFNGSPQSAARFLVDSGRDAFVPESARIALFRETKTLPLTVGEARRALAGRQYSVRTVAEKPATGEEILSLKEVFFRYEKDAPDLIHALSLSLRRGEVFCLVGKGGAGKSTLLRLLAGDLKPQRGKRRQKKGVRIATLPQDVRAIFERETVGEELSATAQNKEEAARAAALFDLTALLQRHPLDLSGGERQRAALAKIWLIHPDILLLDEPTRGLDRPARQRLAALLKEWKREGAGILTVTHDAAFGAAVGDRCALLFDGEIVGSGTRGEFWQKLRYFTTPTARITGGRALLPEEVEEP